MSLCAAFICAVVAVFIWCVIVIMWDKFPAFFGSLFLLLMVIALTVLIYNKT